MRDRQSLAEHGVGICLWGLGLGALTTPIVGVAVLGLTFLDIYKSSRAGRIRKARKQAEAALTPTHEMPERGITAALNLLRDYDLTIDVDPATLNDAATRTDFPNTLFNTLFANITLPPDDGVETALRIVIREAWEVLRLEDDHHKLFTQESVTAIEKALTAGLRDLGDGQRQLGEELALLHTKQDLARDENKDAHAQTHALLQDLLAKTEDKARALHIAEAKVVALARNYAPDTPQDFDTALANLDSALQVAHDDATRLPGNTDDAVNEIIRRVDALNDAGDLDQGWDALQDALAAHDQARMRLLDKAISQAVFRADAAGAAQLTLDKLRLDHIDPDALFDALRAELVNWYERGRDQGVAFDLEVSIQLAQLLHRIARNPDQTGAAQNNLGTSLWALGQRDSGTARLEAAVTAYEQALLERTRDRVPLDWARAQNNLGIALKTLGQRDSDTARLEAAVTAFEQALLEWTRDRVPLNWAATQNNLGNALQTLGERDSDTARLEAAVTAYEQALLERTRDRVPLDWAMTQNNLGNALRALGERDGDTARLEAAVTAYEQALLERTRDRLPLDWAATQNNLGTALKTLGQRESGSARLEAAVTAFEQALLERTRDRLPLDWAATQNNLGTALKTLGERDSDTARLEAAVTAFEQALLEWTRDRVPLNWAMTQGNLCGVHIAYFDKPGDPSHLDTAQTHLDAARAVFDQAGASHYLAIAEEQQAEIDARRAAKP